MIIYTQNLVVTSMLDHQIAKRWQIPIKTEVKWVIFIHRFQNKWLYLETSRWHQKVPKPKPCTLHWEYLNPHL